jgi:hypothetical protein
MGKRSQPHVGVRPGPCCHSSRRPEPRRSRAHFPRKTARSEALGRYSPRRSRAAHDAGFSEARTPRFRYKEASGCFPRPLAARGPIKRRCDKVANPYIPHSAKWPDLVAPIFLGPMLAPGKRARKGMAMRGRDGDHERRSPYLPSGYYPDEDERAPLRDPPRRRARDAA